MDIKNRLTSVEIWQNAWPKEIAEGYIRERVEAVHNSVLYQKIIKLIKRQFNSLNNLEVVELGSGEGIYSLLLGMSGAKITCIDFSDKALARSRKIFDYYGIKSDFIQGNVFDLPESFKSRYDISISAGVAEHFLGEEREDFFKVHLSVLKRDGLAIVAVPNAWCLPYRIMKFLLEKTGKWILGVEVPFSRKELLRIARNLSQIKTYEIFAGSFSQTLYTNLLVPARIGMRKMFSRDNAGIPVFNAKMEKASPLDNYLGNLMVLAMSRV